MSQFKKYRESIPAPIAVRLFLSLFVGLVFLGGLTWMMYPNTNRLPAFFPSLVFLVAVGMVAFILLSLFYKVLIRISKIMMASSGEKEIILRISGVKKDGSSYIRCKNIQTMEIRPYHVPVLACINPFYSRRGDDGEQVIILPGYRGDGIFLSYTYEALFSQKTKTHTILFPTKDAHGLLKILKGLSE